MRRTLPYFLPAVFFSSLAIVPLATNAQAADQPTKPEKKISRSLAPRPASENPDRVILTFNGDPAHTQAVSWRTDESVTEPAAQILADDASSSYASTAKTVKASSTTLESGGIKMVYHTSTFEGLEPDHAYLYRVGSKTRWSEWFQFRTASVTAKPFSFIYFGDAQNDIKSMWSRVIRKAYAAAPDARFIVHAGDLTGSGNSDGEWADWFEAGGWINSSIPSVPAAGNHEYPDKASNKDEKDTCTPYWKAQFALPNNGPDDLKGYAYYFDYQGVRVIALASLEKHVEQAAWLKQVLTSNPCKWTVVTFHHPVFSSAKGRDNVEVRENWKPLFDQYHVDLVLSGHDHVYGRSKLETGAKGNSPTYITSVSGPKMYVLEKREWMIRAGEQTQLFQVISINGDRLKFEARTATGELYDAFQLTKRSDGNTYLKELLPAGTPERLAAKSTAKE